MVLVLFWPSAVHYCTWNDGLVLEEPVELGLKRKLMSLSHGQELCQLAVLASDWLFTLVQPIRSRFVC